MFIIISIYIKTNETLHVILYPVDYTYNQPLQLVGELFGNVSPFFKIVFRHRYCSKIFGGYCHQPETPLAELRNVPQEEMKHEDFLT